MARTRYTVEDYKRQQREKAQAKEREDSKRALREFLADHHPQPDTILVTLESEQFHNLSIHRTGNELEAREREEFDQLALRFMQAHKTSPA